MADANANKIGNSNINFIIIWTFSISETGRANHLLARMLTENLGFRLQSPYRLPISCISGFCLRNENKEFINNKHYLSCENNNIEMFFVWDTILYSLATVLRYWFNDSYCLPLRRYNKKTRLIITNILVSFTIQLFFSK